METNTSYLERLERRARTDPDRVAIRCPDETVTYGRLLENTGRFANVLLGLGVEPKSRVVLAFPDCPDSFYAFFGSMRCGAMPVLIGPDLSRNDYELILADCQASVLVTVPASEAAGATPGLPLIRLLQDSPDYRSQMASAAVDLEDRAVSPEEVSFIQYTSGSTGKPKGVPHSQRDMLFSSRQYASGVLGMGPDDVVLSTSKLSFGYGFGNSAIFPLHCGGSSVVLPGKPAPAEVFRLIDRHRPTILCSVPTIYGLLLKSLEGPVSMPSVRLCVSAGEALPASTFRAWKELTGLEILDGLGSTEALHIYVSNRPGDVRPGSSGLLVPGYEARLVAEDGSPAGEGEQGILHLRGPSTAPFYWNRPGETADTMLADGWVKTGDFFTVEKGCFTYQGRHDDVFKVGGAWVSPIRVEEELRSHPAVAECAVTSTRIEGLVRPIAFVVPGPDVTVDWHLTRVLRDHMLERLPTYMCPVRFDYVAQIPKTRTGKVQRRALGSTPRMDEKPEAGRRQQ